MPSSSELRDHGGVSEPSPRVAEWLSVSRAAELTGVPKRTLYAYVERREIAAREIDGVRHVQLEPLRALLAARQNVARANSGFAVQRHDAAAPAAPDVPDLADARARIERRRLEAEEMRAVDGVREVRDELADAEAARAALRVREELAAERARVELDQLVWRHRQEHAEAERAARQNAEQHRAKLERERGEVARSARRQQGHEAARRWARDLEDKVALWAAAQFGPQAMAPAREAVCRVLDGRTPADGGAALDALLDAEVDAALAEFIAARHEWQTRQGREDLVTEATAGHIAGCSSDDALRIRHAADRAALQLHPSEVGAAARVAAAARAEHRAIQRERAAEEQRMLASLVVACIEAVRR